MTPPGSIFIIASNYYVNNTQILFSCLRMNFKCIQPIGLFILCSLKTKSPNVKRGNLLTFIGKTERLKQQNYLMC